MAITQVGSATSATSGTAVTGLDFAVPTGIASGDVIIATFSCNSAEEIRLASRWIALDIREHGTWTTVVAIKIANGADTGNYNFGIWVGTSPMVITCTAWRGVSPAWPCEHGESAHSSFAANQSEPLTTPTVSGSSVEAGRVLYIRSSRIVSATPITHSESTAGVSELVDAGVNASGTSYSAAQYVDDADFSTAGSKSGLAITASASESHTSVHTIVLRASNGEQAWTLDGTTTWTRPDSTVTQVQVECWGGGGGGGAGTADPGSGGGGAGGSYARKNNFAVDGTSHTVTVASPVGNAATAGSTGQTTWFKSNDTNGVVAVGGPGGAEGTSTSTGGAGGTGTTTNCFGDTVFAGGNGSTVNPDLGGSTGGSGASPAGAGNNAAASVPGDTNRFGGGRGGMGKAVSTAGGHQGMWYGGAGAGGNTTVATNSNGGWGGGGLVRIVIDAKTVNAGVATATATANAPTATPASLAGSVGGTATANAPTLTLASTPTPDTAVDVATANDPALTLASSPGGDPAETAAASSQPVPGISAVAVQHVRDA